MTEYLREHFKDARRLFFVLFFPLASVLTIFLIHELGNNFPAIEKYQTLLTGLCAIAAAWITAQAIQEQIKNASNRHALSMEVSNLQLQRDLYQKAYGVANTISGDLSSLLSRIKEMGYVDFLKEQERNLKAYEVEELGYIPINGNYFTVFDNMCNDIGILMAPLPKRVCYWYSKARGIVDTNHAIAKKVYQKEHFLFIVKNMLKELEELVEEGGKLLNDLDKYSRDNKKLALEIDTIVNNKINPQN